MDNSSSSSRNSGRKSRVGHMPSSVLHWKKSDKEKMVLAPPSSQLSWSSENSASIETKRIHTMSAKEMGKTVLSGFPEPSKSSKDTLLGPATYSGQNTSRLQSSSIHVRRPIARLQKPMVSSVSAKASSKQSLSSSSDSVESLRFENIARSQSFSHSKQNLLLPFKPLTRSHSFNKTADLTVPCRNKPFICRKKNNTDPLLRNSGSTDVCGDELKCKNPVNRPISNAPLLNTRTSFIPISNSTCSSFIHRGHSPCSRGGVRVFKRKHGNGNKNSVKDLSLVMNDSCKEKGTEWFVLGPGVTSIEKEQHDIIPDVINLNGEVDEISISSLSSCDKNDQSEECDVADMDDQERRSSARQSEVYIAKDKSSLMNTSAVLELSVTDLAEESHLDVLQRELGDLHFSSGSDLCSAKLEFPAACSIELSPSDSSDGTYMWDEEGMEHVVDTHPCCSYDSSDMNSQDILNNLDSFDLEDDDLMLDVDLPEDAPIEKEYENMASQEGQGKCAQPQPQRHGLWRRRAQNWGGQAQYVGNSAQYRSSSNHDLSRAFSYPASSCSHFEGYSTYRPPRVSLSLSLKEDTVTLDELTLCHMIQECTSVKTQLLRLKRLLQKNEEDTSLQDLSTLFSPTLELQKDADHSLNIGELLSENVQLKEDVKNKDAKIQHLQLQLATRCNCLKENNCRVTTKTNTDKFTQTPWKGIDPPILQPSSHILSTRDGIQEKLAKTIYTEAPSKSILHVLNDRTIQSSPHALCVPTPVLTPVIAGSHRLLSRVQVKPKDFAPSSTASISFNKKDAPNSPKQHDLGISSVCDPQKPITEDKKTESSTKLHLKRQVLHSGKLQLVKPKTSTTRAISAEVQKGPSSQNGKQSHVAAKEVCQQSNQGKRTASRKIPVLSTSKTKHIAMPKTSMQFPLDVQLSTSGNSQTQVSAPCSIQQISLRKENTKNQEQDLNFLHQKGGGVLRHSYLPKPKAS
ncbi:serine-rich coiled-coil domain-containing protein 2 isoform X2 [Protopterus annectens]|uniref:serine-rich coiled-coil domain-containing protein 2 isoform X2 n=1 Tax=Protopterus annectens TaxID=7888 RepID=UPI001CFB2653|nr:serine-rich coiled-coil domain-containing protein 2 isoform X2 [Protopterus annectens]